MASQSTLPTRLLSIVSDWIVTKVAHHRRLTPLRQWRFGLKLPIQAIIMNRCRRITLSLANRANRKGKLFRFFCLVAVLGVELLVLVSLHVFPEHGNKTKSYDLRYRNFAYGRGISTVEVKPSNDNQASRKSWVDRGKSRDVSNDYAFVSNSSQGSIALPLIRSSCSQFNFTFASPIVEPIFSEQDSNLFLLVLVMSGAGRTSFLEQRNAIRSTWLMNTPNLNPLKWKHVFLIGRSNDLEIDSAIHREAHYYNDILVFNFTDNYKNLIIKVFSGFRWAFMQANSRFILKADDDVFVNIPHLISWLNLIGSERAEKFYGGRVYGNGAPVRRQNGTELSNIVSKDCFPEERFPPYSAGPFYVVSWNIIPSLFRGMRKWKVFPVEDAYVGVLANTSDIQPVVIPGFQLDDNITYHGNCRLASSVAFGHRFDGAHLYYLQSKLQEIDELRLSKNFTVCVLHQTFSYMCMILLYATLLASIAVTLAYALLMLRPDFMILRFSNNKSSINSSSF